MTRPAPAAAGPATSSACENAPADGQATTRPARWRWPTPDPGTNGSQFFLVYKDTELPARGYTIFGTITKGLDVVQKVADAGVTSRTAAATATPTQTVTIESVTVGKA